MVWLFLRFCIKWCHPKWYSTSLTLCNAEQALLCWEQRGRWHWRIQICDLTQSAVTESASYKLLISWLCCAYSTIQGSWQRNKVAMSNVKYLWNAVPLTSISMFNVREQWLVTNGSVLIVSWTIRGKKLNPSNKIQAYNNNNNHALELGRFLPQ